MNEILSIHDLSVNYGGIGASGDTAFFKKHSNINGFRTPEQRNYLYSALLKPSISAAIARFISR